MTTSLEERYGSTRKAKNLPSAFWVALVSIAALTAAAFLWWVQVGSSQTRPEFKDIGHSILSADRVSLTFEVVKAPQDSAVCAVKALNEARAPVGWTEVSIGPNSPQQGDSRVRQETVTFRVLQEATAVTVDSCWSVPES